MSSAPWLQELEQSFMRHADPSVAVGQKAYMRHQFDFYGLPAPVWKPLVRAHIQQAGYPAFDGHMEKIAREGFTWPFREMQYAVLWTWEKRQRFTPPDAIETIEALIQMKSWWDTVDYLAKLAGLHFMRYPDQIADYTERWISSDNMWLQRVALIYSLGYKEKTDKARLFDYIIRVAHSDAFFLQKAAGWALRQYARTDPEAVRHFVERQALSPLTRREALKHLG